MSQRVLVYGTLRKGGYNHVLLGNSPQISDGAVSVPLRLQMYSMGGFPAVVEIPSESMIVGEVYEVEDDTLDRLDSLENHPNWYCRQVYDTDYGPVWVYVMPRGEVGRAPIVACNDWVKYQEKLYEGTD